MTDADTASTAPPLSSPHGIGDEERKSYPSPGIRRLDWRFLLPGSTSGRYRRLCLAGAPGGLARLAHEVALAEVVTGTRAEGAGSAEPADLLALLAGSETPDLEGVSDLLARADTVWWEVDRLRLGGFFLTPGRARLRLAEAGLTTAEVYWAKGGHGSCSMYLPLGKVAPRRWYFDSVLQAGWPVRWALRLAERLVSHMPGGFAALVPAYGIIARRDPASSTVPAVLARGELEPLGTGTAAMLLYGEGDWSRVVHVPFHEGRKEPAIAVKYPRLREFNGTTRRERRTLLALKERLGEMRNAVAQSITEYEWQGLAVTVESWIKGRPMFSGRRGHARGGRAIRDLAAAADWLTLVHTRTVEPVSRLADLRKAVFSDPAADYLSTVGDSAGERAVVEALSNAVGRAGHLFVGGVLEHRDFGPWNVYRTATGVAVIDWEVAEPGLPLCDLLYFAMHWLWITTGARGRAAEAELLVELCADTAPRSKPTAAARAALFGYLRAMRLDPALIPIFMVHLLLRQAVDLEARRAARPRVHDAGTENRYADYVRALAGRIDLIFGPAAASALDGRTGNSE